MSLSHAQRQRIDRIARGRSDEPLFLLEGRRAVRDALRAGVVSELWLSADLPYDQRRDLEEAAAETPVRMVEVGVADFRRLGRTVSPQGVLALVHDTSRSLEDVLQLPGWLLWLDNLQDPGNVGAVVRVAVAFGAGGLVASEGSAHPLGLKALRSSAGLALQVPFARAPAESIASGLQERGRPIWLLERDGDNVFDVRDVPEDFVLIVGSEGKGPGPRAITSATRRLGIPINGRVDSLNAAVATGIAVSLLTRGLGTNRG